MADDQVKGGSEVTREIKSLTKSNWTTSAKVTNEELQLSAMMRIADATEMMALNHIALVKENKRLTEDRDLYRRWYEEMKAERNSWIRRTSAFKGQITKLKNHIKACKKHIEAMSEANSKLVDLLPTETLTRLIEPVVITSAAHAQEIYGNNFLFGKEIERK